jgi:hypothetical protein
MKSLAKLIVIGILIVGSASAWSQTKPSAGPSSSHSSEGTAGVGPGASGGIGSSSQPPSVGTGGPADQAMSPGRSDEEINSKSRNGAGPSVTTPTR